MLSYEKELWDKGVDRVAGVDEVGRGCLAGPIVAAAVIWSPKILTWKEKLPEAHNILSGIKDSKKLTHNQKGSLNEFIKKNALMYSVVEISNKMIDKKGIGEANRLVLRKALEKLDRIEHALVDHFKLGDDKFSHTPITRGDAKSLSIASASIIAKVYRDKLMGGFTKKYPLYGFENHVGYGTKQHREAISKYGLSPIHRKSFKVHTS